MQNSSKRWFRCAVLKYILECKSQLLWVLNEVAAQIQDICMYNVHTFLSQFNLSQLDLNKAFDISREFFHKMLHVSKRD